MRQSSFSFWCSHIIPLHSGRNYGFNSALNLCWRSPFPNMTFPCRRGSLNDTELLFPKGLWKTSFWKIPQYLKELKIFLRVVFINVWSRIKNFKSAFRNLSKAVIYNLWIEQVGLGRMWTENNFILSPSALSTYFSAQLLSLPGVQSLARHMAFSWSFIRKNSHFGN